MIRPDPAESLAIGAELSFQGGLITGSGGRATRTGMKDWHTFNGMLLSMQFHADGENLKADIEIAIADLTADGSAHTNRTAVTASVPAAKWEEARQHTFSYQRQWKPVGDVSRLRVIVHDIHSGQYGTLEVPLNKLPAPPRQ